MKRLVSRGVYLRTLPINFVRSFQSSRHCWQGVLEESQDLPFSKRRSWHRVFGALRPDHAYQLVIDTHDHAYGLARTQSRARRDADSGSADLRPCRPVRSVVNVRVKSVVDCDHTADQLARGVGCAIGIVSYFTTETGIRRPASHCPSSAIETGAKNLGEVGPSEANDLSARVHRCAIGRAGGDATEILRNPAQAPPAKRFTSVASPVVNTAQITPPPALSV